MRAFAKEEICGLGIALVERNARAFDPREHTDEFRAAVEAAAADKVVRDEVSGPRPSGGPERMGNVIDLADVLSRSLRLPVSNDGGVPSKLRLVRKDQ